MTYLLTIKDAADESRFSESYIRKQIRLRKLQRRKFGRDVRIERAEFERWVGAQTTRIVVTKKGVSPPITGELKMDRSQPIETTRVTAGAKR